MEKICASININYDIMRIGCLYVNISKDTSIYDN